LCANHLRCHRDTASLCRHLLLHSTNECWSTHRLLSQRRDGNRIKEHQLDLERDRTSTHEFESNQLGCGFPLCLCLNEKKAAALSAQTELATALRQHHPPQTPWQPKSALVFDGWCYQFLLDWTISACSRLSTIAAGTSFGIICHFCDNTYFEIDAWGEPYPGFVMP